MNNIEKFLIYTFIIPFSFDFKGKEDGGSLIQFALLGLVLLSGFIMVIGLSKLRRVKKAPQVFFIFILLWGFYLVSTVFTAAFNEVSIGNYVRVILPYFLTGLGMVLVSLLYSRGRDLKELITPILLALWISTVWTIIYSVFILDIPMHQMRYQIISPVMHILFSYAVVLILTHKKIPLTSIFIGLICFSLVALSITRSLILMLLMIFVFIVVAYPSNLRVKLIRKLTTSVLPIALMSAVVFPVIIFLRPNTFDTWQQRMFANEAELGFDVTFVTRLAEYSGQMKLLFEDYFTVIFGRGVGSIYYWDPSYFAQLSQVINIYKLRDAEIWTTGHSLWVYSIYSSGVFFGWIVPFFAIAASVISYRNIKNVWFIGNVKDQTILLFYSLICVAIVSGTFTANPYGVRLTGLLFGLGFSLSYLIMIQFISERKNVQ